MFIYYLKRMTIRFSSYVMLLVCLFSLEVALAAQNQNVASPIVLERAVDSGASVTIDGVLDEKIWDQQQLIDDFLVIDPDTLQAPPYRTEVRMFYTGRGLYIGVRNEMPAAERVKRLSNRDAELDRDALSFSIDPGGRGLFGYQFTVNLGGSVADASILPERDISLDWDGAWWSATSENEDAWFAELLLPWTLFAMPEERKKRKVSVFVERKLGGSQQSLGWPPLLSTQPKFLSNFQQIQIEGVNPKRRLTWYPFVSSTSDFGDHDNHYKVGADIYWRPQSETLLSATLNPDFGQVESDEAVVNLSAFETFFEEKRDFFVEGQEIFDTGNLQLVNTRRIGGPVSRAMIKTNPGEVVTGVDEASELLGAAKLTHQHGGWRYGFLGAAEKDSTVEVTNGSGVTGRADVKGRDFAVLRALYEDTDNGYKSLGVFSSHVLHENGDAHVQAVDAQYRTPTGEWKWRIQALRTETETVAESDIGEGIWGDVNWIPRQGVEHDLRLLWYSENMQVNDLGYLGRNDFGGFVYNYTHNDSSDSRFKNIETNGMAVQGYNHNGLKINQGFNIGRQWFFHDNSSFRLFGDLSPNRWDDKNSRGNGDFKLAERWFGKVEYKTDASKKLSFELAATAKHEDLGGLQRSAAVSVRYIANYYTDFKMSIDYKVREGWLVHRGGANFTSYDALHWEPRIDGNIFFNDKQNLSLSMQWVGLRARAAQRYTIVNGRRLQKLSSDPSADDFSLSDIIVQLRYKWNIAPLSHLFVVYTRGGTTQFGGQEEFSNMFEDSFNKPSKEQLIVKLRYRFGG